MTAPAAGAIGPAIAGENSGAGARTLGTVNPVTGLSTDYLNHFAEAIMVLEMAAMMPDCLEDLRAWRPKTYQEHFALSQFTDRDAVIAAYHSADPDLRTALDNASAALNAVLAEIRDAVMHDPASHRNEALTRQAVSRAKPLIARATAIINGTSVIPGSKGAQDAIDALFGR